MATIKKPAKKYADGGSVTTSTKTTKKPESTVMKPLAKKDRYSSLGGEIGEPPFGGKKPKPGTKVFNGVTGKYDVTKKNGGAVKKAKSGGSFPDLNKDGKVTKADILKGRGVIAKSGAKMKKAEGGINVVPRNLNKRQLERVQRINETSRDRANKVGNRISDRRNARGAENPRMNGDAQFNMKSGGKMKKCKTGCK